LRISSIIKEKIKIDLAKNKQLEIYLITVIHPQKAIFVEISD
jgi:hypothetical protein